MIMTRQWRPRLAVLVVACGHLLAGRTRKPDAVAAISVLDGCVH